MQAIIHWILSLMIVTSMQAGLTDATSVPPQQEVQEFMNAITSAQVKQLDRYASNSYVNFVTHLKGDKETVKRMRKALLKELPYELRGTEWLPEGEFLLVGNHRSAFDPLATLLALRDLPLAFISKRENERIYLVNKYMHAIQCQSVNRENVRAYDADPLCGYRFTLNGYKALLTLMSDAYSAVPAGNPDLPIHFISGAEDPCAPDRKGFEDAVERLRRDGYRTVTAKMYPGMRHEILNDDGRQEVMEDLAALFEGWQG